MPNGEKLPDLIPSWRRSLRAANKAPRTIDTYLLAVEQLADYLNTHSMPLETDKIRREHIEAFLEHVLDTRSPATAAQRYASIRQFFRWAEDENEVGVTPMLKMSPPKIPEQPLPVLSDETLKALLEAAKGSDFDHLRDTALIRLFLDTGVRLSEAANLKLGEIDLDLSVAVVLGRGRRPRTVPFGNKTTLALDRYVRARKRHRLSELEWLWLGRKGQLTASGVAQVIKRRSRQAGIDHVNPHQFRHTFAHRWLAAGGQEGDLQQIAGWADRQMLARYGSSAAAERARDARRRLSLGDQL